MSTHHSGQFLTSATGIRPPLSQDTERMFNERSLNADQSGEVINGFCIVSLKI